LYWDIHGQGANSRGKEESRHQVASQAKRMVADILGVIGPALHWLTKPVQRLEKPSRSQQHSIQYIGSCLKNSQARLANMICPASDSKSMKGPWVVPRKGSARQSNLSGSVGLTYEYALACVLLAPLLLQDSYIHEVWMASYWY